MDTDLVNVLTLSISIAIAAVSFCFGYIISRLNCISSCISSRSTEEPVVLVAESRTRRHNQAPETGSPSQVAAKPIEIDESKFVATINTSGMQRADKNELGKTSVSEDETMQQAVSKLAQLKGDK